MARHFFTSAIALIIMALSAPSTMTAQEYDNAPVSVSREKVRINGQVCYSHIVLEKQTLFSISKAYNVSLDDIYKYNPDVKQNGLKKNSILIIPVIEEEQKITEPEKTNAPAAKKGVKRKKHTVKWYEDIESIAKKYGVSVNAIMKANELTSKKLTKRQKLVIPNPGEYQDEEVIEITEAASVSDSTAVADTAAQESARLFPEFFFPKKEVSVSLLLPLKATGTESSRQNMDFYSGVLLAVYDLAQEGISTDLNVYDIAGGNIPAYDYNLKESDLIIGPVASGDINRTFEAIPHIKGLVSPLDPRAESIAAAHESMIQAPTPHSVQYLDLVSWMKEDMKPGDKVMLITEKGAKQTEATKAMTAAIDSSGLEYRPLSYSILEGRDVAETMTTMMTDSCTNRIYIASESEAFVNDVVRNLNVMIHKKYDIVLYAPSKIRSFETIEVENFHNTSMRISTGYYIDYENPKVMDFLRRYRALYNTEPTQFAFQGYDVAKYFIGLCSKYGNRWMNRLDREKASMLQSTFDFSKSPEGGHVNNGVRRIVYGDKWSVEKIR